MRSDPPGPIPSAAAELERAPVWLNSEPPTAEGLNGRVVLVDLDLLVRQLGSHAALRRAWAERYADRGLVSRAAAELGVEYLVVIDNDFAVWR